VPSVIDCNVRQTTGVMVLGTGENYAPDAWNGLNLTIPLGKKPDGRLRAIIKKPPAIYVALRVSISLRLQFTT